MAPGVAVLQSANHHGVDGGAGDDAELPAHGYRPREAPVRNANAHPALDDRGDRSTGGHRTGPHFGLVGDGMRRDHGFALLGLMPWLQEL